MDLKKTGRLISKKRKALNLTQEQLSQRLFVTPQAVSLWERGQRFPDPEAQIRIFSVLGLNPIELLSGVEIFDDDLKRQIAAHLRRIDEDVPVAETYIDEDGFEEYIDLSDFLIVTTHKDGESSDKWIPYKDYYNVEPPVNKPEEHQIPKEDYDPSLIYLNHGSYITVISVELLEAIGSPKYFSFRWNKDALKLLIVAEDEWSDDCFDVPDKVYNGKWKGIHVYGGKFGIMLLHEMQIKRRRDLLKVKPLVNSSHRVIEIFLDEVKLSGAELAYGDFLLPQWQYDELAEVDNDE